MYDFKKEETELLYQAYLNKDKLGLKTVDSFIKYLKTQGKTLSFETVRKRLKQFKAKTQAPEGEKEKYLENLRKQCFSGDATGAQQKLYAEMMDWIPKDKKEETKGLELTPSDYIRIANDTIRGLREDYLKYGGNCPCCGIGKVVPDPIRLDSEREHDEQGAVATVGLSSGLA